MDAGAKSPAVRSAVSFGRMRAARASPARCSSAVNSCRRFQPLLSAWWDGPAPGGKLTAVVETQMDVTDGRTFAQNVAVTKDSAGWRVCE